FTLPPPPRSTLFPYTTLFRSRDRLRAAARGRRAVPELHHDPDVRFVRVGIALPGAAPLLHSRRPAAHRHAARLVPEYTARTSGRSEEHTSELQSRRDLVCRLL